MGENTAIHDLFERFRRGPEMVRQAAAGVSPEDIDTPPASGKWTVRQIACHLADAEMVGHDRFSRVIAEDKPAIAAYDEGAWAAKLNYHARDFAKAIDTFCLTREANYELLKDLPDDAWMRTGVHSSAGTLSLGDLLRIYVEHAENHAGQIRAAHK